MQPLTTWLKRNWLAALCFALMLAASVIGWFTLSGPLPVHWDMRGNVDRFGSKLEALSVTPLAALFGYALALILPKLGKDHQKNTKVIPTLMGVWVVGCTIIYLGMIAFYLGVGLSVSSLLCLGVGICFVGVGNFMPKVAPNRWVGLRAPWVYRSDRVWYGTQRAGGWVLTLCGVYFILAGLFTRGETSLLVGVALLLLGVVGALLYSLWLWRTDDPQPSA